MLQSRDVTMLSPDEKIKYIIDCITLLAFKIQNYNSICFYDLNRISENVYADILNAMYGWELKNENVVKSNIAGFDLQDDTNRIIVQVSSERKLKKLKCSLQAIDHKLVQGYTFKFLSLVKDPPDWSNAKIEAPEGLSFDPSTDVMGPSTLAKKCNALPPDSVDKTYVVCRSHFGLESNEGACQLTVSDLGMFINAFSDCVKQLLHVKEVCLEYQDGAELLRQNIHFLLHDRIRSSFIDVDSSLIGLRLRLLHNHDILAKLNTIEKLHGIIDDLIIDDIEKIDVDELIRAIDLEIRSVVQILDLFVRELKVDRADLFAEFNRAIQ